MMLPLILQTREPADSIGLVAQVAFFSQLRDPLERGGIQPLLEISKQVEDESRGANGLDFLRLESPCQFPQ